MRRLLPLLVLVPCILLAGGPEAPVTCEVFGGIATPPRAVISWCPLEAEEVIAIRVDRDGDTVAELSADAMHYEEEPLRGEHTYTVSALLQPSPPGGDPVLRVIGECTAVFDPPRIGGFLRGDSNADGRRDVSDAVFILRYLFAGGPEPGCLRSGDSDDSGKVDATDPVFLLDFLFLRGSPIPDPFQECSEDRTPDPLGCERFGPCFHPPPP